MVTINKAGYYKIELTALMTLNKFQHRVEVFKKSSGATCDENTVILALNAQDLDSVTFYLIYRCLYFLLGSDCAAALCMAISVSVCLSMCSQSCLELIFIREHTK